MFLDLLRDLVSDDDPAVTVLFTIRSDSYEPLQSDPRLEGLRQETHSLAPMPSGAYKDVITGPGLETGWIKETAEDRRPVDRSIA